MAFDAQAILEKAKKEAEEKAAKAAEAERLAKEAEEKRLAEEAEKREQQAKLEAERREQERLQREAEQKRKEEAAKREKEERERKEAEEKQRIEEQERIRQEEAQKVELEKIRRKAERELFYEQNPDTIVVGNSYLATYPNIKNASAAFRNGMRVLLENGEHDFSDRIINAKISIEAFDNTSKVIIKTKSEKNYKIASNVTFKNIQFENSPQINGANLTLKFENCSGNFSLTYSFFHQKKTKLFLFFDNCNFGRVGMHCYSNNGERLYAEFNNCTIGNQTTSCPINITRKAYLTFNNCKLLSGYDSNKYHAEMFEIWKSAPITANNCEFLFPGKKMFHNIEGIGKIKQTNCTMGSKADLSSYNYLTEKNNNNIKQMQTFDTWYWILVVLGVIGGCILGIKIWKFLGFFIFGSGIGLLITLIHFLIRKPLRKKWNGISFDSFIIFGIFAAILAFFLSFKLFFLIPVMHGFWKFILAFIVGTAAAIGLFIWGLDAGEKYTK